MLEDNCMDGSCHEADLVAQAVRCDDEDMHPTTVYAAGGPYYAFFFVLFGIPPLLFAMTLNPRIRWLSFALALPGFAATVFARYFSTWTYAPTTRITLLWPAYLIEIGSVVLSANALFVWPFLLSRFERQARLRHSC